MILHDMTWHDMTWHDMTWHDMARHNTISYRITSYVVAWYGIVLFETTKFKKYQRTATRKVRISSSALFEISPCPYLRWLPSSSLPTSQLGKDVGKVDKLWIQMVRWTELQWLDDYFCPSLRGIRVVFAESGGWLSVLKLGLIPTSNPKKWYRFRFTTAHLIHEAVASAYRLNFWQRQWRVMKQSGCWVDFNIGRWHWLESLSRIEINYNESSVEVIVHFVWLRSYALNEL